MLNFNGVSIVILTFALLNLTGISVSAHEDTLKTTGLGKDSKQNVFGYKSLLSDKKNLKKEAPTHNEAPKKSNDSIIEALKQKIQENTNVIAKTAEELETKINETNKTNEDRINEVSESLSKNSLIGIIGVLLAILLSGLLYWLLSRRQKTDKIDMVARFNNAKKFIEEELVQINTKLAELYNVQMELLKQETKVNSTDAIDHSLALKVADEIVKMQMNLAHMDNKVRGHRQLSIAVANVLDNFKAKGYEIVDLLNKPYKEGMNMQATMEPDPSLKEGEQIIRRIIKPEIYFNNKIIQHAQVIVAYGE
ncbi:MAG: hypothetical protein IPM47_16830 [Sphingobacteriales bacterium]|nr:MAG: hypothetical protein IPM47_16830 [Sphingobacteriales bacterium]